MLDHQSIKWGIRGFALTAVLLATALWLAQPTFGQDQPNQNEQYNGRTDDPNGQAAAPLPSQETIPNNFVFPAEATSSRQVDSAEAELALAESAYTSPLVIPAADFRTDGINPDSTNFSFFSGHIAGNSQDAGCVQAPAYLPHGAQLSLIAISAIDNDATNIPLILHRVNNFTGAHDLMASIFTAGNSSTPQSFSSTSIAEPLISYPTYSYYVTICLSKEEFKLFSTRIYYTIP